MSKHTPGLLTIQPYVDAIDLLAEDGSEVATIADRPLDALGMPPDNAKRLAACWNACDGLLTESLERGVVQDLLAALKRAVELYGKPGGPGSWLTQARAAIAKAETKA